MRPRTIGETFGVVALSLTLGWVLSLATTRVANWFVMTDELYYGRLAIAVAQTGSVLPRIHGELVANVNQLYPVLLSPVFGDADVPASLASAHRLNAFVMATAAIPVYLLARRVGVGTIASLWAGGLAAAVPWMVLSSFLLTEVVAYPVFCWALLAVTHATARKSAIADVLALAGIGFAVLARMQFVLLLAILGVAVVAETLLAAAADGHRGRELVREATSTLVRTRRVLVGILLGGLVIVVGAVLSGNASRLLGSYSVTAEGLRVDLDLLQLAVEHVAVLALGLAILPFVVGVGWLVDRVRPAAPALERAFALVGCATLVLLTLQVASFNQRFGAGLVKDRYLFYAAPVVLVALAATLGRKRWPRWWAFLVPTAVCCAGFASLPLRQYEKLNVDSPIAMLNDELLRLSTSTTWAQVVLVLAAVVSAQFLLVAGALLPRRAVAVAAAALATVAIPGETVYAFDRLFAVNGTNGLPVTLDQGGVFNWIDRNVGRDGRVTVVKYPVGGPDWWAGQGYWWDVEFWNESAVDTYADMSLEGATHWTRQFDQHTGAALATRPTQYVLVHGSDVRFRLAGEQVVFDRGAFVFEPDRPWRAAWLTDGIYPDGWTRPRTPARITVFAEPGQPTALRRFLTIAIASPDNLKDWPATITSNLERWAGAIPPNVSVDRVLAVCVPVGGTGTVTIEAPFVSDVYRDPTQAALTGETDRPVGLLLRSIALADETVPMKSCPAEAT